MDEKSDTSKASISLCLLLWSAEVFPALPTKIIVSPMLCLENGDTRCNHISHINVKGAIQNGNENLFGVHRVDYLVSSVSG